MKKMMFNDRFGLTEAVLSKQKDMTRRVAGVGPVIPDGCSPKYSKGEIVAVAQSYEQILLEKYKDKAGEFLWNLSADYRTADYRTLAGWKNKMFVKACHMLHHIRITGVHTERLCDITDGDCYREGIIPVEWRQWLEQDLDDLSPQQYRLHRLYTLPKFEEAFDDWGDSSKDCIAATTPQAAFYVLLWKISGKKLWQTNPWVHAYEFKLVD